MVNANFPAIIRAITSPTKLWGRSEVLASNCPVPPKPGIYGWYFREIPPNVPTKDCIQVSGVTLLYVGVSPRNSQSTGNLCERIKYHFEDNAEGSTLRRSLGCLLAGTLSIQLGHKGKSMHFGPGECQLNKWMDENAYVVWAEHPKPWLLEKPIVKKLSPPLNITHNTKHPFCATLKTIRKQCENTATTWP